MKNVLMICAMGLAISLFPMFQQNSMAGLNDGLVAYYPFNGNANDESGKGHNGTINGAVLTSDRFGNANSAYAFDGTNDYIDVADATDLNPTTAITITAWFKANSFALGTYSWPHIVDKCGSPDPTGYFMAIVQVSQNNPCVGFAVDAGGAPAGVPTGTDLGVPVLTPGTWYFAAGVYDGTAVKIYVGTSELPPLVVTSANYSGNMVPSSNNLNIGRDASYPSSTNRFFHGAIDDVRIYNRALSSSEIEQIYVPEPACTFSDNFNNGVIDTSKWAVGGGARGWHADQPIGTGSWEYSPQEIVASPDGYFQAHVWGPMSGNTYGAEAWIRTLDNFNDGKNHVINFTWEPGFLDYHNNGYFIQVTDGYIANPGNYYWMSGSMWPYGTTDPALAGTTDFLWTLSTTPPFSGFYFDNMPSIGKVSWSLEINSLGTARLYDSPDASGSILHEATLDPSRPWYIRFMVHDGTSAGYPAGDAWFKLYDFSATCEETEPAWSFVQISDTHIGYKYNPNKCTDKAVVYIATAVEEIKKLNPEFILVTGDIVDYACTMSPLIGKCVYNKHYDRFFEAFKGLEDKLYIVPGNHDRYSGPGIDFINRGLSLYNDFINPKRPSGTTIFSSVNDYYFTPNGHNDLLFVGLDSGAGISSDGLSPDQLEDLRTQLDGNKSKIIFMHHPAYAPNNPGYMLSEESRDQFIDYCENNNVKLVLSGHTHQNRLFDVNGVNHVQTSSCAKKGDGDDTRAYRIVDVKSGIPVPRDVNLITKKTDFTYSICCSANLHVYDSFGQHVGVTDTNEAERNIPHSFYFSHYDITTSDGNEVFPEQIVIVDPCDGDYLCEVVGKERETYRLEIISTKDGNDTVFEANGIPTLSGAIHQYVVDWDLLVQGGDGVTILVDQDGDGDFEKTVTSDNELTPEEFNIDPIADAGVDQTVFVGTDCLAQVSLNGSDSNDPDGGELNYKWSLDGQVIATGVSPTVELSPGQHTIELVVNDGIEDSEPDYVVITVRDNTPPELTVSVTPNVLWPPNHKMVQISSSKVASDNCDDLPIVTLISIVMNEGEETNTFDPTFDYTSGDGHTIDDIQIINGNIYLRAERSGTGTGRVYTLSYKAVDDSGNVVIRSATVTVPHSQP